MKTKPLPYFAFCLRLSLAYGTPHVRRKQLPRVSWYSIRVAKTLNMSPIVRYFAKLAIVFSCLQLEKNRKLAFFNHLRFFYKSFDGFPSDYLATLAQMLSCINKVGGGRGFCGKVTAADHLCGLWRAVNRGVGPFLSRDSCSQGGRWDLT